MVTGISHSLCHCFNLLFHLIFSIISISHASLSPLPSFSPPSSRLPDDRDIILSTTTVTLTPDQLETSVNVTGFDDNLYEGAESAQLAITSLDIAVLFSSPSPTIDVEIVDNDCE